MDGDGQEQKLWESFGTGVWPPATPLGVTYEASLSKKSLLGSLFLRISREEVGHELLDSSFDLGQVQTGLPAELDFITKTRGVLLVSDPENLATDLTYHQGFINRLLQVAAQQRNKPNVAVAVVLTKMDKPQNRSRVERAGGATGFIQKEASQLYIKLMQSFEKNQVGFFAVSAVGRINPLGNPYVPITPEGVPQLLKWLVKNVDPRGEKAKFLDTGGVELNLEAPGPSYPPAPPTGVGPAMTPGFGAGVGPGFGPDSGPGLGPNQGPGFGPGP